MKNAVLRNHGMESQVEEGFFKGDDSLSLYYQFWKPKNTSRACLVLIPGNPDHVDRFEHVFQYFVNHGFSIWSMDLRGNGRSAGTKAHADSWDQLIRDMKLFLEMISQKTGNQKLFLIGHSNGGMLSLRYGIQYPEGLSGVIVSSPNIRLQRKFIWIERKLANIFSRLLPKMQWSNGIDPSFLSHDPRIVEVYRSDELISKTISSRMAQLLINSNGDLIRSATKFRLPCFLMHGGDDLISSPRATQEFYEKIPIEDKALKIYEGLYHEIFNENVKDQIFEEMESWVEKRI